MGRDLKPGLLFVHAAQLPAAQQREQDDDDKRQQPAGGQAEPFAARRARAHAGAPHRCDNADAPPPSRGNETLMNLSLIHI